jgi:hypothetical protein
MSLFLRLFILCILLVALGLNYLFVRRKLNYAVHLPLDFALALYLLTFATGCFILYLFGTEYLVYIFGYGQFLPSRTSYDLVLVIAAAPFAVVPWMTLAFDRLLRLRSGPVRRHLQVADFSMWLGTMGVFTISSIILAPVAGPLISNAAVGMQNTVDLFQLYEQRRATFDSVSWLQGGIIYTTLPSIATILLFWPTADRRATIVVGGFVGIVALLLNVGTFQIGPTLAFVLTYAFCFVAVSGGRINLRRIALPSLFGVALLALYSIIKTSGYEVDAIQAYLLRLPAALPYLIQYAGEQPGAVQGENFTLTYDLASYMYPELVQYAGWVATPQPAFVDAYFTFNIFASAIMLGMISLFIVITSRFFYSSWISEGRARPTAIFTAVIAAPVLYYSFQVDFMSFFNSAYSGLFALPPILATLFVNALVPSGGRPARKSFVGTRP